MAARLRLGIVGAGNAGSAVLRSVDKFPGIELGAIADKRPEVVILAPCGFDVRRGLQEIQVLTGREGWALLPAAEAGQLYVVDSNSYLSRSGPRIVVGLENLAEVLHPEIFTGMVPERGALRLYGRSFRAS
jgi:iron complex transport system substrate-binding protein